MTCQTCTHSHPPTDSYMRAAGWINCDALPPLFVAATYIPASRTECVLPVSRFEERVTTGARNG